MVSVQIIDEFYTLPPYLHLWLCEVSDQVQDKISNQMFKNDF